MSVASINALILLRDPDKSTETRLDDLIAQALLQLNATTFGDKYDMAVALQVLHWLAKEEGAAGAGGPVVMEKEGDLTRRYANPPIGTALDDLDSSQWGRELKTMIRTYTMPFMTRMV